MKKQFSVYPTNTSDQYWKDGLYDACITLAETYEFPIDYNRYNGIKNKNDRNMLQLTIDASCALYDNSVTKIRFYNYKILVGHIATDESQKIYWVSDKLTVNKDFSILETKLLDYDSDIPEFAFTIEFERMEVDRK